MTLVKVYLKAVSDSVFTVVIISTGLVTFTDVTEDQYTLHAQADDHTSYSAVIIASPDEATISVFLQRIAVKYTWTVTPTDVQDTYVITLDSTFETYVSLVFR